MSPTPTHRMFHVSIRDTPTLFVSEAKLFLNILLYQTRKQECVETTRGALGKVLYN